MYFEFKLGKCLNLVRVDRSCDRMLECTFSHLSIDIKTNDFVALLKVEQTQRYIPIWIGNSEALAIGLCVSGIKPRRPLTHDLLIDMVNVLGAKFSKVIVTGLKESTYYALIHLSRGTN
jgi:uncharacterized protein